MKTKSISDKTATVNDRNRSYREAGDPQKPAALLLHILKKLIKTMTTKDTRQIYGWTHFWKDLSRPFYGHTKAWWPGYLAPRPSGFPGEDFPA